MRHRQASPASPEDSADYIGAHCSEATTRTLSVDELPLATTSHVQIDCDGFDYFGAARRAEFVFADDALTHVWILVEAEDLAPLQARFETEFGAPDHATEGFTAFNAHNAALRRDIPEALYYSEAAAPLFQQWFAGSAGE